MLPNTVILNILKHVDYDTFTQFRYVSKQYFKMIDQHYQLWEIQFTNKVFNHSGTRNPFINYKIVNSRFDSTKTTTDNNQNNQDKKKKVNFFKDIYKRLYLIDYDQYKYFNHIQTLFDNNYQQPFQYNKLILNDDNGNNNNVKRLNGYLNDIWRIRSGSIRDSPLTTCNPPPNYKGYYHYVKDLEYGEYMDNGDPIIHYYQPSKEIQLFSREIESVVHRVTVHIIIHLSNKSLTPKVKSNNKKQKKKKISTTNTNTSNKKKNNNPTKAKAEGEKMKGKQEEKKVNGVYYYSKIIEIVYDVALDRLYDSTLKERRDGEEFFISFYNLNSEYMEWLRLNDNGDYESIQSFLDFHSKSSLDELEDVPLISIIGNKYDPEVVGNHSIVSYLKMFSNGFITQNVLSGILEHWQRNYYWGPFQTEEFINYQNLENYNVFKKEIEASLNKRKNLLPNPLYSLETCKYKLQLIKEFYLYPPKLDNNDDRDSQSVIYNFIQSSTIHLYEFKYQNDSKCFIHIKLTFPYKDSDMIIGDHQGELTLSINLDYQFDYPYDDMEVWFQKSYRNNLTGQQINTKETRNNYYSWKGISIEASDEYEKNGDGDADDNINNNNSNNQNQQNQNNQDNNTKNNLACRNNNNNSLDTISSIYESILPNTIPFPFEYLLTLFQVPKMFQFVHDEEGSLRLRFKKKPIN